MQFFWSIAEEKSSQETRNVCLFDLIEFIFDILFIEKIIKYFINTKNIFKHHFYHLQWYNFHNFPLNRFTIIYLLKIPPIFYPKRTPAFLHAYKAKNWNSCAVISEIIIIDDHQLLWYNKWLNRSNKSLISRTAILK